MPIARNHQRHEKRGRRGNLGVGGASRVAWLRNRAKGGVQRGDAGGGDEGGGGGRGGGGGGGRKRGGRCTHRDGIGGDRGIAWWQNARWSVEGEGVREGGSRSPRGRTRASTTHTRTRIPVLRTHAVYTRRCNTGVCSVGRGCVCVRIRVGNVRARPPAS